MAKVKTFDMHDAGKEFNEQGHNQRTLAAWECGIHKGVYGGELIYQRSNADYAEAEIQGWEYATGRLRDGDRFKCGECGTLHGRPK